MSKINTIMKFRWLKSCYYGLKTRSRLLFIFPNVHTYVGSKVQVLGTGKLFLGICWKGLRHLPSELCIGNNAKININGNFNIYSGFHLSVADGAEFSLGDNGYINSNATINVFHCIKIGDNVKISKGFTIRDSDNHCIGNGIVTAPIVINDNVWIGLNVTILKGVTIGKGAVVAAGAVVTKNVPAGCLVGGVPAKVIRENVEWH